MWAHTHRPRSRLRCHPLAIGGVHFVFSEFLIPISLFENPIPIHLRRIMTHDVSLPSLSKRVKAGILLTLSPQ